MALPIGFSFGEKLARESLVDNRDARRLLIITVGEEAACAQSSANCRHISGAAQLKAHDRVPDPAKSPARAPAHRY